MPGIARVAFQMMILFVLMCAWAVTSGWKHQTMNGLEGARGGETDAVLSITRHAVSSGKAGVYAQTNAADIESATAIAQ